MAVFTRIDSFTIKKSTLPNKGLMVVFLLAFISACGGNDASGPVVTSGPTYYIDATLGLDTNSGTTATSPWKTLARLDTANYYNTTTILLKRGEVWTESLNLKHSEIIVDAYGSGANPRIDGSRFISGWSVFVSGIFSMPVAIGTNEAIGNLTVNGTMMSFVPWNSDPNTTFSSAPYDSYSYVYPNTLYIKPANIPPSLDTYRASVLLRGVYADGLSNITIRNLDVTRVSLNGIEFKNCTKCSVDGSTISRTGGAYIAANATPPPNYLYAGNGIDFSNSCSNGSATNVTVSDIFDSCVAVEIYTSNQSASNMQIHNANLNQCGFAGIETSVLRNVNTVNSVITNLAISNAAITQMGHGWSGRRYGTEGHGIRIIADAGAGSMSGISVTTSQVSGSAGDGMKLAGELNVVNISRVNLKQNSGHGLNIEEPTATTLQLNLSSSILDRNAMNGINYNAPLAAGLMVYHNTFYDNAINLEILNQTGVADIRNNLFYLDTTGTHLYSASALATPTLDHNCYNDRLNMIGYAGTPYSSVVAFNTATGFEANGTGTGGGLTNPTNGIFTLLSSSNCRGLGDSTTGVTIDYRGTTYATPPSSGAFEYP